MSQSGEFLSGAIQGFLLARGRGGAGRAMAPYPEAELAALLEKP